MVLGCRWFRDVRLTNKYSWNISASQEFWGSTIWTMKHKIPRGTFHLDVFFLYGHFTDLDVQSGFLDLSQLSWRVRTQHKWPVLWIDAFGPCVFDWRIPIDPEPLKGNHYLRCPFWQRFECSSVLTLFWMQFTALKPTHVQPLIPLIIPKGKGCRSIRVALFNRIDPSLHVPAVSLLRYSINIGFCSHPCAISWVFSLHMGLCYLPQAHYGAWESPGC